MSARPLPVRPHPGLRPAPSWPGPPLAPDDEITPERERALAALAAAARAGDLAARDALYRALAAKIDRFVASCAWTLRTAGGPRRDGAPWDAEDLAQEAFPIFADLVATWPEDGPFGPYFLSRFPWRLRDVRRALIVRHRVETAPLPPRLRYLVDESAAAEAARLLLADLATGYPPADGSILLWHVRDGASLDAVARRLGMTPRTVRRRWRTIKAGLQAEG